MASSHQHEGGSIDAKPSLMSSRLKDTSVFALLMNIAVTASISVILLQALAYVVNNCDSSVSYELHAIAILVLFIQWLVFLHASGILFGNVPTEKFYDLTGASTYFVSIVLLFVLRCIESHLSIRQVLLGGVVLMWCLRLGSFLYRRICDNGGVDTRFTRAKKDLSRFFFFWTMQGIWVFVTSLPVLILLSRIDDKILLTKMDYIGLLIFFIGFTIEVLADTQKQRWHQTAKNRGHFITTGLWSISRHPNYVGEILLWTGITLASCSGYTQTPHFLGLMSPFFVYTLLRYISGVPLLEAAADNKWGQRSDYLAYKESVPVLFPLCAKLRPQSQKNA